MLEDKTWVLSEMSEVPIPKAANNEVPSLEFSMKDGRLSGYAGCNRIMGSFEIKEDQLKISRLGGTKRMCPDMEMENKLISVLQNIDRFQLKRKKLTLFQGEQALLVFEPLVKSE